MMALMMATNATGQAVNNSSTSIGMKFTNARVELTNGTKQLLSYFSLSARLPGGNTFAGRGGGLIQYVTTRLTSLVSMLRCVYHNSGERI